MTTVQTRPVGVVNRWAGWALMGASMSLPFMFWASGRLDASVAVDHTALALGWFIFVGAIGWVLTLRRSSRTKAIRRIVVGLVLMELAFVNVSRAGREQIEMNGYLVQSMKMQAAHSTRFGELNKRFAKVPVEDVLASASVTNPKGIANARATIAQQRALIAERDALLKTYWAEIDALAQQLRSGRGKRGAIAALEKGKPALDIYAELSRAQSTSADRLDTILDWCAVQNATMTSEKGQLVFATLEQHRQWRALLAQLSGAEADEQTVLTRLQAIETASLAKLERAKAEAAKALQ